MPDPRCFASSEIWNQIPSREEIPEVAVWQVLQDVGESLRHVHAMGLVHLDVKPANLLVGDEGIYQSFDV